MSTPHAIRTAHRRFALLGVVLLALLGACFAAGDFLKSLTDQRYVDMRGFLGVPNFLNVASNVAFLLVGAAGLRLCAESRRPPAVASWRVFYAGMLLTAFGSAWFHLAPSDATLLWDRAGMVIVFVGLLFGVLEESTGVRMGVAVLAPALLLSLASVWWWRRTGDMRVYSWVQLAPLACAGVSVILTWLPAAMRRALAASFACYMLAKLAELYDAALYTLTAHVVSGHTLKHLLAAASGAVILAAQWRRATPDASAAAHSVT
jgi:hypothetical protein